ncbi:unnamed protein product, partial [Medioppia subpectinata]
MFPDFVKTLLTLYLLCNCFEWSFSKPGKNMDKEIEDETNKLVTKSCCPMEFEILVLTNLEECYGMTPWQFGKDPILTCRKEIFKKEHPCNEERKGKCNNLKDRWLDCIDSNTEKEKKGLKPKYQKNEELIKELPKDKMVIITSHLS